MIVMLLGVIISLKILMLSPPLLIWLMVHILARMLHMMLDGLEPYYIVIFNVVGVAFLWVGVL